MPDMLKSALSLVRKYPIPTAVVLVVLYLLLFGFKAILYFVIGLALVVGFLIALTDDDLDDDDWSGPFRPA